MILSGAYGRVYMSKEAVMKDFDANKDFFCFDVTGTGYVNKEQIPSGTVIEFRYGKHRERAFVLELY